MRIILKHGVKPKSTLHIHECEECKCVFGYTDDEVFFRPSNYIYETGNYQAICCPECANLIELEVPKLIKNGLK